MPNTLEWRRQVRNLAKEVIPPALETSGSMYVQDIYARVSAASSVLCDDSIPCQHENPPNPRPEWQHMVRSALDILRRGGIVRRIPPKWGLT